MAMGLKMSMKLSQQLRMTPQLQQAIKLLQMSRMELETAVRKELIENPVLEEVQDGVGDDPALKNEQTKDEIQNQEAKSEDAQDPTKQDEFDWESYMENQYKPPQLQSGGSDDVINYENIISSATSLNEHLIWQVGMAGFNEEEETYARILVDYIDDDGYIKTPLEDIARDEEIEPGELEEILPFIQEFDPAGVGARNLKECLLIQAKHLQEDTKDLVTIIENHLEDLQRKNFVNIAKIMGSDLDYIVDICQVIFNMDPKPGRIYITSDTHYISPDVYVYKVGDEYVVSLNEEGLPRLKVSALYKNLLKTQAESKDKKAQDYIQDKLRSAVWLIKSIHQRQRTIYKVTESIVKHQEDFFEKGPGFIKPMILKDIANDIGMHESTVSRVTTSKYVHTPQGIFELKYFFNSGINKTDGDSVASETVKLKIKALVDNEDVKKPLSDQKIVDLLKKDGIKIARRTVAKYRDVLKILPSSKRKKFY